MTSKSAIEEIRRAADIVEMISSVVPLKKAGASYKGLCPFHQEKDPSFTVNPSTQTFYCFGCHEGGDVFSFFMKYHHLSFSEAVRELGARFGVSSDESSGPRKGAAEEDARKKALYELNAFAASFYHRTLLHPEQGREARGYLDQRGIGSEHIREFKLGFAPGGWQNLINVFNQKRVPLAEAERAGLVVRGTKGSYYDRFRDRIVFPIWDTQNKVLGLGGRVLDQALPKYLNSPETPIYQKGRVLYGLPTGLKEGRKTGRIILVEGYMDLLALVAHGVRNVVASLGTALTREQVRLLKRTGADVLLAFDCDEAGKKAVMRSAVLFYEEDLRASVLHLDSGEDPDDCIRREGRENFLRRVEQAVPIAHFCIDHTFRREIRGAADKENVLRELGPLVRAIRSRIEQLEIIGKIAKSLQLDENMASMLLEGPRATSETRKYPIVINDVSVRLEEQAVGFLLRNPRFISLVPREDLLEHIRSDGLRTLMISIFEVFETEGNVNPASLLAKHPNEEFQKTIARMLSRQDPGEEFCAEKIADDLIQATRRKRIRRRERDLTQRIREAEAKQDTDLVLALLRERSELIAEKTETI